MAAERFVVLDEPLGAAIRLRILNGLTGELLECGQVLGLWETDDGFRDRFSLALAQAPFEAFFWETPCWTQASLARPFECVIVPAPSLAGVDPDPSPFGAQFKRLAGEVVAFDSLGRDARLIAPRPVSGADFGHFATFLRSAPQAQIRDVWRRMAEEAKAWIATGRPVWISTSGLGVYWLHLRLDSRPKYYSHVPYRVER